MFMGLHFRMAFGYAILSVVVRKENWACSDPYSYIPVCTTMYNGLPLSVASAL